MLVEAKITSQLFDARDSVDKVEDDTIIDTV